MKQLLSLLVSLSLVLALLAGCGSGQSASVPEEEAQEKKLSIVTTIFPEYDWVCQILGDRLDEADVTMLLDSGVDLHNYQPTADDIVTVSNCDLFIYVGGESDEWVEDVLAAADNPDLVAINLLEVLGDSVKEEEIVEGMEAEEEEEAEGGEEEVEYDEHVWLSLRNASVLCQYIADCLGQIDPDGKPVYDENAAAYIEQLNELDGEYQAMIDNASQNVVLFGDRFPFRYLTDDYGLAYYAAFVGCSAETEASFETVVFLASKMDELGLSTVLKIEGGDGKLAQTIVDNTQSKSAQVLELNSMQSVTAAEVDQGAEYLAIMEQNLYVLEDALQ